ncbi:hypothetical protein [Pedobacter sp.]|uniref:hypothetical protein n=1 Tax=Pedobacter sp. TaxID=1411316 RepID=UPI003D7F7ABC
MKVLITGGNSSAVYKILKAFEGEQVLLADYGDTPAFAAGNYQFVSLGEKNEDITAHHLLNTCLDHGVDAFLPLHVFEVLAVAKALTLFEEFNIQVLIPSQVEIPMYLQNEEDVPRGQNWALFAKGELIYSPQPSVELTEIGLSKKLNGLFYVPQDPDGLTAVLFTLPE